MVSLLEDSLISPLELSQSDHFGSWLVTSLNKALLPQLLSLARQPALGKVQDVPNTLPFKIIFVLVGTVNAAEMFL